MNLLGSIFVKINSYRSPEVLRIIGFTPKRAVVELVPCVSIYHQDSHNTESRIDTDWLHQNPVPPNGTKGPLKAILDPNGDGIRHNGDHYFLTNDLNYIYWSCEY